MSVSLFLRPRRFGKSLFISMLDNFFNIEKKEENKNLFNGLKISKSKYYKYLSTKPVIKISFKELKGNNYEEVYNNYKELIRNLYSSKRYLYDILESDERKIFDDFVNCDAVDAKYNISLKLLSDYMYKYYKEKVIILIDEYDVPIQEGYINNFYDEIIKLIKSVFSSALKDNDSVYFGIMTGVLRVSKESLFSDLNNVKIYNIVDNSYNECFGFTNDETAKLLSYYGLELNDKVKLMYDGYNFAGSEIYNPWSILNYADEGKLISYWVNTSGNELIHKLVRNTEDYIKLVIEKLLTGESVKFDYNSNITYKDFDNISNLNSILNILFASGYLTIDTSTIDAFGNIELTVKLPNEEVKWLFNNILQNDLVESANVTTDLIKEFSLATINNDAKKMEETLNKIIPNMSYMDSTDSFYHGYMLGLFSMFISPLFIVKSNRESGSGRFDLMIEKKDKTLGIIIELKVTREEMESVAINALNQIETKEYYEILVNDNVEKIIKYAIVFKGKNAIVR